MDEMIKLIEICQDFKAGKFSVEEFQKRIETVYLPVECKNTLEQEMHNALEKLEEIIFCYKESQKHYADEVAELLMQATWIEQKRLKLMMYDKTDI